MSVGPCRPSPLRKFGALAPRMLLQGQVSPALSPGGRLCLCTFPVHLLGTAAALNPTPPRPWGLFPAPSESSVAGGRAVGRGGDVRLAEIRAKEKRCLEGRHRQESNPERRARVLPADQLWLGRAPAHSESCGDGTFVQDSREGRAARAPSIPGAARSSPWNSTRLTSARVCCSLCGIAPISSLLSLLRPASLSAFLGMFCLWGSEISAGSYF